MMLGMIMLFDDYLTRVGDINDKAEEIYQNSLEQLKDEWERANEKIQNGGDVIDSAEVVLDAIIYSCNDKKIDWNSKQGQVLRDMLMEMVIAGLS
jgi:hypothetical protein